MKNQPTNQKGIRVEHIDGKTRYTVSKFWPSGEHFRRRVPNFKTAKQLLARIEAAIAVGTWRELQNELKKPKRNELTVNEFADVYLEKYCRVYNTRPDFKEHALKPIRRLLGSVRLSELRRADVLDLVAERSEEDVSPATVNRSLAVLKNMLAYAVETEVLAVYPLTRFRSLPEDEVAMRVMGVREERQLVAATLEQDAVIGCYVGILGEVGLRKTEGLNLNWKFVDLDGKILTVEASKNYDTRRVPLTDYAVQLFGVLKDATPNQDSFCFVRDSGERWNDPRGPFIAARSKVGMDWVGFHGFRHYRCTEWVRDGMSLERIQGLLGHKDIATTQRYVHYVGDHDREAVKLAEDRQLARLHVANKWQQPTGESNQQSANS